MLFEQLVIHNFGIYKGRHQVDLTPQAPNKPIILFGALNGGGKTTFLDALQLVLYGKFANCSNRGTLSYHDYLARTINSHVLPSEGAGLELQFTHVANGTEERYRVIRTWRSTGKGIREDLEVLRNGVLDPVITERWYEYVEEFIPSQISSLFFFDGEKIEALADKERSAQLLRTGIHALLGLDLVDQLSKDLCVIERRRQRELATKDEQAKLKELETIIHELDKHRQLIHERIGEAQTHLDQLERRETEFRAEFRREGGELLEKRDVLEAERNATKARLLDAEDKLREYAAGAAPLLIVRGLLRDAERQSKLEYQASLYQVLRGELVARDAALINQLNIAKVSKKTLDLVRSFQADDLQTRDAKSNTDRYLGVDPATFVSAGDDELDKLEKAIAAQLSRTESIKEQLAVLERRIASIPDPATLAGITDRLNKLIDKKHHQHIKLAGLHGDYEKATRELEARNAEYQRYLERATNELFADESNRRILKHSKSARATLALFRQAVANQHIGKLEHLIAESFKQLIRKGSLIDHVSIDLESYALSLFKSNGDLIPTERLSAGERQLLAVSMLWGLAKASGRPLPTIIDTPLGRLDGKHRHNLVNAYFPCASHQIILLSTDEEIDEAHVKTLQPALGKKYLISYDEPNQSSHITAGYFWE